jgi:predicted site-specific integrase-resolvase
VVQERVAEPAEGGALVNAEDKKRAALYARVSTQEQAEEGKESLDTQEREMRAHCSPA